MKYTKLYLSLLAAFAFAAVSCDKTEVPEYEPAPGISSEQVFFPASVGDQIKIADGETSFTVPVQRGTANLEAIDVEISASGEGVEYFTIPGVVSFASQAKTANLVVTVTDVEALGKNNFYEITLSIADDSLTTPYGHSSITFTAGIELPWIKFDSGIYYNWFNDEEYERTMEYQQISETMRLCRVQDYWDDEDDPLEIFWYWDTNTNYCFVLPIILGAYDGSTNVVLSDMASFYTKYNGWESQIGTIGSTEWFAWAGPWMASRDDVPYYDGNGTFYLADWIYFAGAEDGIPTGRGYQFGGDGEWFKGKSFGDYTLSVSYDGMRVSTKNVATPVINFSSTKESAKYYSTVKYIITSQDVDAAATLDAMVAGKSADEQTITLKDGSASVQPGIEPGQYRIVAVPFVAGDKNDDGESTEYKVLFAKTVDFYFPGLNAEVQKEVAVGDYIINGSRSSSVITVRASEEENVYFVENLGIANGASWYAYFDPKEYTLTLNGYEEGYEQYGNQFGSIYGYFDSAMTKVYGLFVYDSEESYGDDALVFDVDPETMQPCRINQELWVDVYDYVGEKVTDYYGTYCLLEAGSSVSPYSAAAKASVKTASNGMKQLVRERHSMDNAKVPFRATYAKAASVSGASEQVRSNRKQLQIVSFDPAM